MKQALWVVAMLALPSLMSTMAGCGLGGAPENQSGPFGAPGAIVNAVVAAPLAPARVYLGAQAGLFVSEEGGQHWPTAPLATFGGAGVRAIAPSSVDRSTLWVVTGAPLSVATASATTTFSRAATATPQPTFPATAQPNAPGALWVSHDAGATWHWAASRLPRQVRAVWAGTASANQAWAAVPGAGLWLTTDDGLDWSQAGGIPANTLPQALLGTDTTGASLLLGTDAGLLRSTDGGKHWTSAGDVRGSVRALIAAPLATHTVYCLTDLGLFRSTDGGAHFAAQSYGLPDTALVVGANPQVLYAVAGVNIHRSTDGGHTWTLLQTATTAVAGIAVSLPAIAFATPAAGSSATATRAAATPTTPPAPADTVIVALSKPAGILISRDGGQSWSQQGG